MYPQKHKIPIAVNSFSSLNLSGRHSTTGDFMEFNVARAVELVPDQTVDVQHFAFSRLEALNVPTFGGSDIRHRAFWVPYRTVFPAFTDMITDTRHQFESNLGSNNMQLVPHTPLISNAVLYELMNMSELTTATGSSESYDYKYTDGSTTTYKNLTRFGRYVRKILRSLGYEIIWHPSNSAKYTAMPLLCLMRVFVDWYYPSQYAESSQIGAMRSFLSSNKMPSDSSMFTASQLYTIFSAMRLVSYDPSYLVSAWDRPNGPNATASSNFSIPDINNVGNGSGLLDDNVKFNGASDRGLNNAPAIVGNTSTSLPDSPHKITQYALTALRALNDYLKRHQLAGSRALDRYLARFGVKLPSEKLNRSVLVESYSQRIEFFDVTSTASTDGASLGSFAGKGVSYGDGKFTVDTNGEYGMLIVITTIIPDEFHYQGMLRHVLHKSKLDFFTPEFDALGVQAISKAEAYVSNEGLSTKNLDSYFDGVFGFTPRYAEYKYGFSQVTGDYDVPSLAVTKEPWTLGRNLKDVYKNNPNGFTHNIDFIIGKDSEQFNRIFQVTEGADHFNIDHFFKIQSRFPGKSLFDDYEFKDEDKSKKITVDVNGSTVN